MTSAPPNAPRTALCVNLRACNGARLHAVHTAGWRIDPDGQSWDGGSMTDKKKPAPPPNPKPALPMSPPAEQRFRGAPWFFRAIRAARKK